MEPHVFFAVLAAAALHAGWNAMLKLKLEPLMAIALISIAAGFAAIPWLPFAGLPRAEAWPYVFASLAIHLVYYLALGEAYRTGDLGQVYPIARGSAPLITAVASSVLLGERPGFLAGVGIAVLAGGIIMLSLKGGRRDGGYDIRAVGFALLTAFSIAAYTVVDGVGARLAGTASAYSASLFVLDGFMMLGFGLWRFPGRLYPEFRRAPAMMLAGGAMSMIAYAIAIWAMTRAPIALVSALRETSVLFAALIGIVVLREAVVPLRVLAALLVLAGMALIRM